MCRKFTVEHQEVGTQSISIEAKVSNNPPRATRTNNRCSPMVGDSEISYKFSHTIDQKNESQVKMRLLGAI